jgi:hypothetical protein
VLGDIQQEGILSVPQSNDSVLDQPFVIVAHFAGLAVLAQLQHFKIAHIHRQSSCST